MDPSSIVLHDLLVDGLDELSNVLEALGIANLEPEQAISSFFASTTFVCSVAFVMPCFADKTETRSPF
jgi:hypothetical protein